MQLFINNWETPLLHSIDESDQEISVAPEMAARLVGLGDGDYYLLTLAGLDSSGNENAWEVVKAVDVSDGYITIERGQEGTAAGLLPAGSRVSARLTAGTLAAQAGAIAAQAESITALQAENEALAARVTALEGGGSGPSFVITVGSSGTYVAGYVPPMGAADPNSITIPAGSFSINTCAFYNDSPPRFTLIFNGKFAPTLVQSVDVEGCGVLARADAITAQNEQDGSVWYTVFEWEVESTDWFASIGANRTVSITLSA